MRHLLSFLAWLFSPQTCPYCKVTLEAAWSGSDLCPKCGYDNMTGKKLVQEQEK